MLTEYLFVFDNRENSFPERFLIRRNKNDVLPPESLTAVVELSDIAREMKELHDRYPSPAFDVSRMWANGWSAVEHNYRGMRDH